MQKNLLMTNKNLNKNSPKESIYALNLKQIQKNNVIVLPELDCANEKKNSNSKIFELSKLGKLFIYFF